jgi:predicted ATP-dependent endonuclease of OLD family
MKQNLKSLNNYLTDVISKDWEDTVDKKSFFKGSAVERDKDINNSDLIHFKFIANNEKNIFLISERSKGCKWFFCFKILTEIRKNREKNGVIFLLDEPASNLHIHPQEKILKSLEKLSEGFNVQTIYTTHSPFLINTDNSSNIIIVENNAVDEVSEPEISCKKYSEFNTNESKDIASISHSMKPIIYKQIVNLFSKEQFIKLKENVKEGGELADWINKIISLLSRLF